MISLKENLLRLGIVLFARRRSSVQNCLRKMGFQSDAEVNPDVIREDAVDAFLMHPSFASFQNRKTGSER